MFNILLIKYFARNFLKFSKILLKILIINLKKEYYSEEGRVKIGLEADSMPIFYYDNKS